MLNEQRLKAVGEVVAAFDRLPDTQRRHHSEMEVRTNFIDPLFAAIGWSMGDRDHVERETAVEHGKRPDYIFKLSGVPCLFLEAKRFTEDARAPQWARDAITKAYNKGVSWAAVTNFSSLVVYDAYELLDESSRPRTVVDLTHDKYSDPQSLLGELSPEAIRDRVMEKRAQEAGIRTRLIPIERRLYESMRRWREDLFNALFQIKQWRTEQEFHQGDEAIQRLIDRLIFLRNCEDRLIGGTELRALRNRIRDRDRSLRLTETLVRLFDQAARTYDSELFAIQADLDLLLRGTGTILDDPLAKMIEGLYSVPQSYSNYDFSQMEPDVLGEVYEQYLGYVPQRARSLPTQASLPTLPREVTVESKQQRRKEHGIYYTPRWVVQYIVDQTLGRLLLGTPGTKETRPLSILDPACGSGSFLIRAYETLLQFDAASKGVEISDLDRSTRETILRTSIHGVDLDPQAVEIARLNLLIRMVSKQEPLPELKGAIQHGNSLIDGAPQNLLSSFGPNWEDKSPFNWAQRFPDVADSGGFDVIVGNPPYVRIQHLPREDGEYFKQKYAASTGNYDLYCLFVERALELLRPGGRLGFIIPSKFMQANYGKGLRKLLGASDSVAKVIDFGDAQVFGTGTNYTCLLFLEKPRSGPTTYLAADLTNFDVATPPNLQAMEINEAYSVELPSGDRPWAFAPTREKDLLDKIRAGSQPLGEASERIFVGVQTSADDIYIVELVERHESTYRVRSRRTKREYDFEAAVTRPLLSGHDIKRYTSPHARFAVIFPYVVTGGKAELVTPTEFEHSYPNVWSYLLENKEKLESREGGKMRHDRWYDYVYRKNLALQAVAKLCVPRLVTRLVASFDADGSFALDNVDVNGILTANHPFYILALLNSSLIDFCFQKSTVPFRGGFSSANRQFIEPLPIKIIDPNNPSQCRLRDELETLAKRMVEIQNRRVARGDVHDYQQENEDKEFKSLDLEIDRLVGELYGLTHDERALIEIATSSAT